MSVLTAAKIEKYRNEGFVAVEGAIEPDMLTVQTGGTNRVGATVYSNRTVTSGSISIFRPGISAIISFMSATV